MERLKEASPEEFRKRKQQRMKEPLVPVGVILALLLAILLIIVVIHSGYSAVSQHIASKKKVSSDTEVTAQPDITIGFTGCMLLHDQILESYTNDGETYDFSDIYRYIKPYYSSVDYMTCEFEGALTGSDYSGYPSFHSPDQIIEAIQASGVDLQLLATNHIYDGLSAGLHRTMDTYDNKKVTYTGIRQQVTDKPYYIADIRGIKVGFINYVYRDSEDEFYLNSIPVASGDQKLINTFDPEKQELFFSEIEKNLSDMKAEGAQFLIACMHWGIEYHLEEAEYQDQIAQKLCDLGVGALIGGHPHCEEPIDLLTSSDGEHSMFCVYSVGNALSNQRAELIDTMPDGHTEDGVMVTLTLHQDENDLVSLKDVSILPTWVYKAGNENHYQYYILPLDSLESIETDTGLKGILTDAKKSHARTMSVLGSGLQKTQHMLSAK